MTDKKPKSIREGLRLMQEAAEAKTKPIDKAKPFKHPRAKKPGAEAPKTQAEKDATKEKEKEAVSELKALANRGLPAELVEAQKAGELLKKFAKKNGVEIETVKESFISWGEARGHGHKSASRALVNEWLGYLQANK